MADSLGRRKALLVEDDTLVSMVSEDALQALGFETICVETAADALEALLKAPQLAIAVVDIGLPDMRGDDLALRIRALAPALPIIIATGYDALDLNVLLGGDPAMAMLGKPYSEHDLGQAIRSLGLCSDLAGR